MAVDAMRIDWSTVPRRPEHRQLGARPRWFNGAPVTSVAVDPRGRYLVTGSDRFLRLFWVASGELVHTFEGPGNEGTVYDRVGLSPDGRHVVAHIRPTRGGNGALGVWDVETGRLERRIESPRIGRISAHDAHRTRVLARDGNAGALLLDAEDGTHRTLEPRPDGGLGGAAFVSERLVVGMPSMDGAVRCWDTATGAVVWEQQIDRRSSAAVSPRDADWIAFGGSRGGVSVHDSATGARRFFLGDQDGEDHADWVNTLDATPDGRFLLSVSAADAIVWDVTRKEVALRVARSGEQTGAMTPGGRHFLLADTKGRISRIAIDDGASEGPGNDEGATRTHEDAIDWVGFDASSRPLSRDVTKLVLAWNLGSSVAEWYRRSLPGVPALPAWAIVRQTAIAEDIQSRDRDGTETLERMAAGDDLAVTLSGWGSVDVWGRDGKHLRALPVGTPEGSLTFARAFAIALHPDGRRVAIATSRPDIPLQLWDAVLGKPIAALDGHEGVVRALAFRADGALLLSGGDDRLVRAWPISS